MEHLPALAFIKDGESRTVYVNKSMDDVLGASSWVGLTPTEYFSGEPGEKILAEDQAAMQTGYIKIEETRPDRLGNQRIYETQKFIIPMAVKQPLLGGIAIDITERKIAEAALKEKTDELMRFNNLMLGRELKMIELKREINELLEHSGAPSKYKIFD
jgi:PAS domain S-box-containing protein